MLKTERQQSILAMCDRYGTITVKFIQEVLDVSDMTIRRDLEELAQRKKLLRVHGGAQKINNQEVFTSSIETNELSHNEKRSCIPEKKNTSQEMRRPTSLKKMTRSSLVPGRRLS